MDLRNRADQMNGIWHRVCSLMRTDMSSISYNTFVEVLTPIAIKDNMLVVEAPSGVIQSSLEKFYIASLNACVSQVAQTIDGVLVILPDERSQYVAQESVFGSGSLYTKYTFDTFVIGSSNYFAHAASMAVAKNPAETYNPLFIYGGVGLGKTHLMHAIGHEVRKNDPRMHVMYVTSETFTNEMIQSIATNKNREFRSRYRNVDVLMVDDIHFISRKEGVQEEFFHTFNTLHTANKQIVISSDRPPREIEKLEERLRSRFEWGLIADIQPPTLETRIAILQRRAEIEKCRVRYDVLEFIAEHVQSNIRELEGSLNRVIAFCQINRLDINLEVCKEALKDMLPNHVPRKLDPQIIKETVADYYGQSLESFSSKRRDQEIAFPRQIAMYLSRALTDYSLPQIGSVYGGRNHTTVLHAYDKISELVKEDSSVAATVSDLKKRLAGLPEARG